MNWDSGPKVTEEELREALRIWGNESISNIEVPKFKKGSSKYQEAINHLRACEKNMMRDGSTLKYGFYFKAEADLLELARRVDLEELAKESKQ